ncbi:MAG: hypothetical protein V1787_03065 [Candidatus Micrarchaeota archaeon]
MDLNEIKAGFDAQEFFEPTPAKIGLFIVASFLLIAIYAYDLYCPAKMPPDPFSSDCVFYFGGYWRIVGFVVGSYVVSAAAVFAFHRLVKK